MTIFFFLADGFEETELIAPVDILRRAEADVKLVSVEDSLVVTGSHGIKLYADISAQDASSMEFDAIVFPGGLVGTERLLSSIWTEKFIKTAVETGAYVAAICAAPTILSKFGLLEGRNFSCYPSMEEQIEGGIYTSQPVTCDDVFITGEAMGSSLEFGFKLCEIMMGKDVSERVKTAICYK